MNWSTLIALLCARKDNSIKKYIAIILQYTVFSSHHIEFRLNLPVDCENAGKIDLGVLRVNDYLLFKL